MSAPNLESMNANPLLTASHPLLYSGSGSGESQRRRRHFASYSPPNQTNAKAKQSTTTNSNQQSQSQNPSRHRPSRNIISNLFARQLNRAGSNGLTHRLMPIRFNHFRLLSSTDVSSPRSLSHFALAFLQRRSRIVEISITSGMLFALTQNGVCAAYRLQDGRRTTNKQQQQQPTQMQRLHQSAVRWQQRHQHAQSEEERSDATDVASDSDSERDMHSPNAWSAHETSLLGDPFAQDSGSDIEASNSNEDEEINSPRSTQHDATSAAAPQSSDWQAWSQSQPRELNALELLCHLNVSSDEVIRSLFLNKCNASIISVSVYKHDNFASLRCRTTLITDLQQGRINRSHSLFGDESLQWPGFVEFDDVNKKILTYSAVNQRYKVWSLKDYTLLYEVNNSPPTASAVVGAPANTPPHISIDEIKISPGIMLLIHAVQKMTPLSQHDETQASLFEQLNPQAALYSTPLNSAMPQAMRSLHKTFIVKRSDLSPVQQVLQCKRYIPLKILKINSGEVLISFVFPLYSDEKLDFVEQFNERLLIKQHGEPLHIVDIRYWKDNYRVVPIAEFETPSAFIFLYEQQLFLTFLAHWVRVVNFRGETVSQFDAHRLFDQSCNTNNIYINPEQDIIMSYCRRRDEAHDTSHHCTQLERKQCAKCIAQGIAQSKQPLLGHNQTLQQQQQQQNVNSSQPQNEECGSVHISHILTGKLIGSIEASQFVKPLLDQAKHLDRMEKRRQRLDARSARIGTAAQAAVASALTSRVPTSFHSSAQSVTTHASTSIESSRPTLSHYSTPSLSLATTVSGTLSNSSMLATHSAARRCDSPPARAHTRLNRRRPRPHRLSIESSLTSPQQMTRVQLDSRLEADSAMSDLIVVSDEECVASDSAERRVRPRYSSPTRLQRTDVPSGELPSVDVDPLPLYESAAHAVPVPLPVESSSAAPLLHQGRATTPAVASPNVDVDLAFGDEIYPMRGDLNRPQDQPYEVDSDACPSSPEFSAAARTSGDPTSTRSQAKSAFKGEATPSFASAAAEKTWRRLRRAQNATIWAKQSCCALRAITALYYNEERNEIYTGNKAGFLHCWGN